MRPKTHRVRYKPMFYVKKEVTQEQWERIHENRDGYLIGHNTKNQMLRVIVKASVCEIYKGAANLGLINLKPPDTSIEEVING